MKYPESTNKIISFNKVNLIFYFNIIFKLFEMYLINVNTLHNRLISTLNFIFTFI